MPNLEDKIIQKIQILMTIHLNLSRASAAHNNFKKITCHSRIIDQVHKNFKYCSIIQDTPRLQSLLWCSQIKTKLVVELTLSARGPTLDVRI